ncbi:MAG: NADH-quinone oxidoreductase subunit N [Mucilaginibacter polytrichastri]|nr:NADH-quinone oxidoreductase subunit N [Mucilaginibacter polytrichastri]
MKDLYPNISALIDENLRSLLFFVPEVLLLLAFFWVFFSGLLSRNRSGKWVRNITALSFFVLVVTLFRQYGVAAGENQLFFHGLLILHRPAVTFKLLFALFSLLLTLYAREDHAVFTHKKGTNDFYALLLGINFGLHLMVMSANLLMIYLSVEIVSVTSYLFTAYFSDDARRAEAGMKYMLFGATASAIMLYGLSLLYVITGSLNLFDTAFLDGLAGVPSASLALAGLLLFAGIGFKLSLVPLHFWVPDVYEGTATPVSALLSTLPKIAGFGLLLNVITPLLVQFPAVVSLKILPFLSVISALTMIAGNFAAVWQKRVKRLLAYSAIGHSGFALMAMLSFNSPGISALLFYLMVYGLANLAAFMLVTAFEEASGASDLDQYRGLGRRMPLLSVCFVLVLISLVGIPLSGGFTGKFLVFSALLGSSDAKNIWLLLPMITGVLTTVVALFYYLQVPLNLFFRKAGEEKPLRPVSPVLVSLVIFLTAVLLLAGVFPQFAQTLIG